MTSYLVIANGTIMGTYEADDEDGALRAYAHDAGYRDFDALADALGKTAAEAAAELEVSPARR